jgi:hypothetical protein
MVIPRAWIIVSLLFGFSKHIQDLKAIGSLGWAMLRGRGDGCAMCDKLVSVVLKEADLDDIIEGGGVPCRSICFKIGSCVRACDKIASAMANSSGFPCVAAGFCPAADEFGEVSCVWSYKRLGCEPRHACEYRFPKCELRSGMRKWKEVGHVMSTHLRALDDAFRNGKRCGEPGAGPYCIREASGLGWLAEWAGIALTCVVTARTVDASPLRPMSATLLQWMACTLLTDAAAQCALCRFVGGSICSVRAIETPGGDDDRQWLTFWRVAGARTTIPPPL